MSGKPELDFSSGMENKALCDTSIPLTWALQNSLMSSLSNYPFSFSLLAEGLIAACKLYSSQESSSEMLSLLNPGEIQEQFNLWNLMGSPTSCNLMGLFSRALGTPVYPKASHSSDFLEDSEIWPGSRQDGLIFVNTEGALYHLTPFSGDRRRGPFQVGVAWW